MTWFSPLLKKTALAVVALLVLVTGATAALAEMHDGEEPDLEVETPATCSDEGSDDAGTGDDEASDESEAASEADDDSTGDECDDENSDDGTEIEDEDEDEDEDDEEDEEGEPAEDEAAPVTQSLEVTEEPEFENHGAAVSHAATEGCRDLQGAEFGHCVAAVAQSDAGKHRDPDGADDEPVIEAEDQEVSSTDAPTPAENPGKGKGEGNAKGPKKS